MSLRRVLVTMALLPVAACSAPEVATPGITDELTATAAPTTSRYSTLECPADLAAASTP